MKKSLVLVFGLCFSTSLMANTLDPAFADFNKGTKFKGETEAPNKEPIKGLKVLEILSKDVKERPAIIKDYFYSGSYVVIDVRPAALHSQCHIKGDNNFEYTVSGAKESVLTKEKLEKLLAEKAKDGSAKKGVIFYCNDSKCYRSTNAAIEAVLSWKIPVEKVMWFRGGVPELAKASLAMVEGPICSTYK